MNDLLFFLIIGGIVWVFYAKVTKRPLIPWKETTTTKEARSGFKKWRSDQKRKSNKKKSSVLNIGQKNEESEVYEEEEPDVFSELLDQIEDIKDHMIHLKDNEFILMAEVRPCNYFLRSQDEQDAIDDNFEAWLATLNYNIKIYLQSKFVDLDEPISNMQKNLEAGIDLPPNAVSYGQSMIEDLQRWQLSAPRYEVKRYILFPYKVNLGSLAGNPNPNDKEGRDKIEEKAFMELHRRLNSAKTLLRKSYIELDLLTTEGITEVLYHAFNRKKALKTKFKSVKERETLSNYVTADKDQRQIESVKTMIKQTG